MACQLSWLDQLPQRLAASPLSLRGHIYLLQSRKVQSDSMVVTTLPPEVIPFYGNSKLTEDEFSSKSAERGCYTQDGKGKPGVMASSHRALGNALYFDYCKVESISM